MFGLTFEKLLLIGLVAVILIGPAQLPRYAALLAKAVKVVRGLLDVAKDRVRDEMGPDFDEVDWMRLDPRQYDPRSIIRDALLSNDSPIGSLPPTPARTSPESGQGPHPASSAVTPDNPPVEDSMYR